MLYLLQLCPFSAAAAGGAAAFADVAAARRAHFRAAGQAERCVGTAALLGFDEFCRAVWLCGAVSNRHPFGSWLLRLMMGMLYRDGLGHLHRILFLGRLRGLLPVQDRRALGGRQDAQIRALLVRQVVERQAAA